MKTINLPTGIKITQDSNGNITNLYSPYTNDKISNDTILKNLFNSFDNYYKTN